MSTYKTVGLIGNGHNKLRFYRRFKHFYGVEHYVPRSHRAAFAKCKHGVAPLKIETGRYMNQPVDFRVCPFCINVTNTRPIQFFIVQLLRTSDEISLIKFDIAVTILRSLMPWKRSVLFFTKSLVRNFVKTCFYFLRISKIYCTKYV